MAEDFIRSDVLIVGAGIAGLMAARALADHGLAPLVVERAESVGGRLATLEMGGGLADYGAQFFTVRNSVFRQWVTRWLEMGLAFEWSRGWSDGSVAATPFDGNPRYAIRGGMAALARHLAEGLDVRGGAQIVAVTQDGAGWVSVDTHGRVYTAPALLLTPPVPVTLRLLAAGQVPLADTDRAALAAVTYEPCLAGVFWVDGPVYLPAPGAMQRPKAPVAWIADNQRKGLSPDHTLITAHAGPAYSREMWRKPDWEVLVALEMGLSIYKAHTAQIVRSRIERWLYAMPHKIYPDRYLRARSAPPLVFAGDAFGSPRMEGAALSGLAAAQALMAAADG